MKKHFFFALGLMMMALGGQMVQARTIDLSTCSRDLVAANHDILTGTLSTPVKILITGHVTLDNVTIIGVNQSQYNFAALTVAADECATLILKGVNIIQGHRRGEPGIFVPATSTLTIQGDGTLIVSTNSSAPAIGAEDMKPSGNIVINSGTIQATGGYACAGIGGSRYYGCGDITINGGNITATGNCAPGIGGGNESNCGNITINEYNPLTLNVSWSLYGTPYSIGAGYYGTCGTITILGQTYTNGVTQNPFTHSPSTPWDGNLNNVTEPVIAVNGTTIHGTLSNPKKVSIAPGATVTLNNAIIRGGNTSSREWAGLTCMGDATIILQGANTVQGGYRSSAIYVPQNYDLYIEGDGSLTAFAKGDGAGIGAGYGSNKSCGTIYIKSGTVEARGGHYAAGIGGAFLADCGNIYISRCAQVKAYKGNEAPNSVGQGLGATNLIINLVRVGTDCAAPFGNYDDYFYSISVSPYIYPEPEEPIEPEEPTCLVPTNLQQTGESEPYAVSVSWTQGGSETKWQVGWRLLGSTEDYSSYPVSRTSDEITGLTPDTDYEIAVRAQCDNWGNELSEWSEPIIVTTMALPQPCDAPTNLHVVSSTPTSITIDFDPGSAYNDQWEVICKVRSTQQNVYHEFISDSYAIIPNLEPNIAYNIWVGARCDEYSSDYNVLYNITTPEPEPEPNPCLPVTNVIVSDITSTSAAVSFTPGSEDQTKWLVYCYIPGERAVFTEYVEETSVTIPDLEPNKEYKVTVKTFCDEETSDWATDVPFTTLEEGVEPNPCLPVTNVIVSDITSTSATVSFTPGSEDQTKWLVYCYIPGERAVFTEYVEETSVTIPDLEPNTEYMVTVMTRCDEEASDWATDVPFTTLEETGIEEIVDGRSSLVDGQKILHEGHLYFLRDGKIFNAQGARVK